VPPPDLKGRIKKLYPLAAATGAASMEEWAGGLIPLPKDYADLMNLAGEYTCENSVTGTYFFLFNACNKALLK
jgi:hypothetical protein